MHFNREHVLYKRSSFCYFTSIYLIALDSHYGKPNLFLSQHYQKKKVVGLERGPLSLVSTSEELLDRKVAAPV
jgi:hypothetical protein